MKIVISNKNKKDLFIALFQTLKNCSTLINVKFEQDKLHIQGMDKSHICLFNVNIKPNVEPVMDTYHSSYLEDFDIGGNPVQYPFDRLKIFDSEEIIKKINEL